MEFRKQTTWGIIGEPLMQEIDYGERYPWKQMYAAATVSTPPETRLNPSTGRQERKFGSKINWDMVNRLTQKSITPRVMESLFAANPVLVDFAKQHGLYESALGEG